jgi:hypothetical protein
MRAWTSPSPRRLGARGGRVGPWAGPRRVAAWTRPGGAWRPRRPSPQEARPVACPVACGPVREPCHTSNPSAAPADPQGEHGASTLTGTQRLSSPWPQPPMPPVGAEGCWPGGWRHGGPRLSAGLPPPCSCPCSWRRRWRPAAEARRAATLAARHAGTTPRWPAACGGATWPGATPGSLPRATSCRCMARGGMHHAPIMGAPCPHDGFDLLRPGPG